MYIEHPVIAILGGTGKEGTGLAIRWAAAGYSIIIGSRQADKAQAAAQKVNQQLGVSTVNGMSNNEAARLADICVLTVVHAAHAEALESLKNDLDGKILVDATSRVEYRDPRPPASPSAAEQAQAFLGGNVRVVAAFQNVPAKSLRVSIGLPMDADALVCSDDTDAALQAVRLAVAAGMRGYYAGPLANANVVEGLTSILISLNKHYGVQDASIRVTGVHDER